MHVPPHDPRTARSVSEACRSLGLECPSYGSYLAAGTTPGGDPDGIEPALEVADLLGATNVRVWAGHGGSADVTGEQRRDVIDDLAAWCERAHRQGIAVSVELHSGTLTDTLTSTTALLEAVPQLWTYWQPRDGDAGDDDLHELETLLPRLSHVHVFWWQSWLERFPLADGAAFWRRVVAQLFPTDTQGAPTEAQGVPTEVSASGPEGDAIWWPQPRWAFIEFVAGDDPAQLRADAGALRSWMP